jgi:hypothetical protein
VTDNSSVAQWTDLSGNGKHLSQSGSGKPTAFLKLWPGSRPCVHFSRASSTFLQASAAADWKFLSDGTPWWGFVVWRTLVFDTFNKYSTDRQMTLFETGGGTTAQIGIYCDYRCSSAQFDDNGVFLVAANGGTRPFSKTFSLNTLPHFAIHSMMFLFDGTNITITDWDGTTIQSSAAASAAFTNSNPARALTVGEGGDTSNHFGEFDIAEMIFGTTPSSTTLSAADQKAIRDGYLEPKWHAAGNATSELYLDTLNVQSISGATQTTGLAVTKSGSNPILTGSGVDHDLIYGTYEPISGRYYLGVGDATGTAGSGFNTEVITSPDGISSFARANYGQVTYGGNTNNALIGLLGDYSTGTLYDPTGATGKKFLRVLDVWATNTGGGIRLVGSEDGLTSWTTLATLQLTSATGEGGFPFKRNDGRYGILYEKGSSGTARSFGLFISDTTDPGGTWTDMAQVIPNTVTTNQLYQPWIFPHGNVLIGLFGRYNQTAQTNWIDLYVSRDEGYTWTQAGATWIPNGAGGTWDSSTIFAAGLIQSGQTWNVYYFGGNQLHSSYPRNGSLGYATVGYERLSKIAGTGTAITRAIYQPASSLIVNADASGGSNSLTAALLDSSGNAISGYADAQSTVLNSNTTGTRIAWSGKNLPNQACRIRFTLTGATLYSWSISAATGGLLLNRRKAIAA